MHTLSTETGEAQDTDRCSGGRRTTHSSVRWAFSPQETALLPRHNAMWFPHQAGGPIAPGNGPIAPRDSLIAPVAIWPLGNSPSQSRFMWFLALRVWFLVFVGGMCPAHDSERFIPKLGGGRAP